MNPQTRAAHVLLLLLVSLVMLAGCGEDEPAPIASNGQLPDFTGLVKQVSPAVVNISAAPPKDSDEAEGGDNNALEGWLRRFFEDGQQPGEQGPVPPAPGGSLHASLGSGFIISDDGYILTNRHVVANAGQIVVKLNDRRQLVAEVVGQDSYSDLAVLKVDATDLPTVKTGDPDKLPVGSWVVAIGSPFGFETSVTAGIVSAKQRSLASDQYVPFLQTDVAINPGNSGGPLFNLAGEVVGINSQIYSQTGGYQGVSFAIPIDIAMDVAKQLRNSGSVTRGWLGVQIQDVDRELAESFKLKRPEGALVARVMPDSPAEAAGLEAGDVILSFNDQPVDSAASLPPLVGTVAPGESASVTVLRDGEREEIDVEIEKLPKDLAAATAPAEEEKPLEQPYGLTLESLDTAARRELELDQGGVRVTDVADGAGAQAGLEPGDIVLAVGSRHVEDVAALRNALDNADGPVALLVWREGTRLYLAMRPKNK
ncbi:serine protease Do protein [Salinisphaera shabanensis E1L3A]|uniref:Probable periplasmic serine endoprotease DegP-like n=1 Tax=Salinisphaera shabanensis E1L3A TaxID=1033802 RepID=U2EJU6_9GAMM|nr:DegQ family serine endoprotease [Salinisphaera shabanensis]ERJ18280.1 serine protease Do protein [Salinisphaera shabanensis E1L3A]